MKLKLLCFNKCHKCNVPVYDIILMKCSFMYRNSDLYIFTCTFFLSFNPGEMCWAVGERRGYTCQFFERETSESGQQKPESNRVSFILLKCKLKFIFLFTRVLINWITVPIYFQCYSNPTSCMYVYHNFGQWLLPCF